MGETLGISHNVFEKAERERDRKERMKKLEDWKKERSVRMKRASVYARKASHMQRELARTSSGGAGGVNGSGSGGNGGGGGQQSVSRTSSASLASLRPESAEESCRISR